VIFRHHIPGPPLDAFVSLIWYYQGFAKPHAKERMMPTGEASLVINLAEDKIRTYDRRDPNKMHELSGAVLVGSHSEYFIIDTAEQLEVAGVEFKPGGAFPFFRPPAEELANQHVPLDALWDCFADDLREQILEAHLPEQKLYILERTLLVRLARPLVRHPAISFALGELSCDPCLSVSEISQRIGLSRRRFTQLFQAEVGLTPKVFSRVQRFQCAVKRIQAAKITGIINWADFALECGYYDQAHLIHDFTRISGLTPNSYLTVADRASGNHVPLAR
jgi:AraC-like DNA-binding protein